MGQSPSATRRTLRNAWVLPAILSGGLAACSFYPKLVIFNHTGQDLAVHVDDRNRQGWNEKLVVIKSGQARKLMIGAVFQTEDRFMLSQQGCRYTYQEPERDSAYWNHSSDVYVVLQVEPDHRVYIRPPGKEVIASSALARLQTPGFPLRPLASRCG